MPGPGPVVLGSSIRIVHRLALVLLAVSWSTIVPFSISNRPEHVTHTPVVLLR